MSEVTKTPPHAGAEAAPRQRRGEAIAERTIGGLRPYRLHISLLVYISAVLVADALLPTFWPQAGLGALTLLVLYLYTLRLSPGQRLQVWLCVLVATGFEILGSIVIGVYRYRLHNIPLYVPPGHGLVFLFGLTAGATPVFQRHGRRVAIVLLAVCAAWAFAGLTLMPGWTNRIDIQGAVCLPILAGFVLLSPRYAMFAAVFVVTSIIEIVGTRAGDWYWLPVAPPFQLPSGNPPSAIAGGYCVIDSSVALLSLALSRMPLARLGFTVRDRKKHTRSSAPRSGWSDVAKL